MTMGMLKGHMESWGHDVVRAVAAVIAVIIATAAVIVAAPAPAWAATCVEKHIAGMSGWSQYDLGKDCVLHIGAGNLYMDKTGFGGVQEILDYMRDNATSIVLDSPKETKAPVDSSGLFRYPLVTSISGLGGIDVSDVTDFSTMLALPSLATPVDLSGWVTSSAVDMRGMFSGNMLSITSRPKGDDMSMFRGLESFDTSGVTSFESMFIGTSWAAGGPSISGWDTSNVETFSGMFWKATLPASGMDLSGWDTSHVTTMHEMFCDAKGGEVKGLDGWKTGNVTDFSGMFQGAVRTTTADLSKWDTSHATTMRSMFRSADIDRFMISGFDVSSVTDFAYMFAYTKGKSPLDLGGWRTVSAKTMQGMFNGVSDIGTVRGLEKLNVSTVTNLSYMFASASGILAVDMSGWDTSSATTTSRMFSNAVFGPGTERIASWDMSHVTDMSGMFQSSSTSAGTVIDLSGWDTGSARDMSSMFQSADLSSIYGLEGLDTGNVTTFYRMFAYVRKGGRTVNMSGWDMSSAYNVSGMFMNDDMAMFVGYPAWGMGSVVKAGNMFQSASFASPVDLSGWDTSKMDDTSYMFSAVKNLDMVSGIGSFDTGSVRNMSYMFNGANGPSVTLDLSHWDTSKATNMSGMFASIRFPLKGIDGWDTSKVTNMSVMFSNADAKGIEADLSHWDTSKVTTMSGMFASVDFTGGSLTGFGSFDVSSVGDFSDMFNRAKTDLLDISAWRMKTGAITDLGMLYSPYINTIRTGAGTRFDTNALKVNNWGTINDIWKDPGLPNEIGAMNTWSEVPDDRTDASAYWTSTGKKTDADGELVSRIASHPGTYTRTLQKYVTYEVNLGGWPAAGMPGPSVLHWPVSPTSDLISTNVPTEVNHVFRGWADSPEGAVRYAPGDPIDHTLRANTRLYAVWERIVRKVRFEGDGATGGMPATGSVPSGDRYVIPGGTPVRPGFTFVGWEDTSDPSVMYKPGDIMLSVSSDISLRAVWRADTSRLPDASGHARRPLIALLIALAAIMLTLIAAGIRRRMGRGRGRHAA